jgi:hypothetical protein
MRWRAVTRGVGLVLVVAIVAPAPGWGGDSIAAPASPTPAAASPARVVLSWTARREEGVYGYLVYRSDRREGPFRRISPEIIHVRDGSEAPGVGSYRFVDEGVEPGRTYYYYLDAVLTTGHKQRLSGVIRKEAEGAVER